MAKKSAPPLYPPAAPVELDLAFKITSVDVSTGSMQVEPITPGEASTLQRVEMTFMSSEAKSLLAQFPMSSTDRDKLERIASEEQERLSINTQIGKYYKACVTTLHPFLTHKQWIELKSGVIPAAISDAAPAWAHDALLALDRISRMSAELVNAEDWPDEIDRALCYAIELGQLLQRGQIQFDYGNSVAAGKQREESLRKGPAAKRKKTISRDESAREELMRRMAGNSRSKDDHLTEMAKVGTWGAKRTLEKSCKGIKRA